MSPEEKIRIAKELAKKRAVMGDTGFSNYIGKIETAIPQRRAATIAEQTAQNTDVAPKGVLGGLARFSGVEKMGVGLGASLGSRLGSTKSLEQAVAQGQETELQLTKAIIQNKKEGKDTTRLENALEFQKAQNEASTKAVGDLGTGGVTTRDVIGSAIRTAGTIASAGTYGGGATSGVLSKVAAPQLTTATGVGRGILQGSVQGLKTGAASGAIFGGVSGTATGIEQGKGVLGTAFEAAKQAAVGGVLGGAVGTVAGGVGGAFQAKANRKEELTKILAQSQNVDEALTKTTLTTAGETADSLPTTSVSSGRTPSKATAGYKLENGKAVVDKPAQQLLKQGIPEKEVAIMQSMSPADKAAAKKMVDIAKEVSDTGIRTQRQQEVAGQTFLKRAKDVETINKTAGAQIDDVARKQLSGTKVNASAATDDFFNQLERSGVDIDQLRLAENADDIAKAFDGSDFEGITAAQRAIKTVLKRVDPALDGADLDGLALHRAKRFIYNQVEYGKSSEGLTGQAENLLKGLAKGIDDTLDTQFTDYAAANVKYKDSIEALGEVRRLLGRDFLGSGDIANLRAGEVMNRLLGNASAKPLSAVQNLENTALKYGIKYDDSIIKQITFADLLDDIYETVPKGSLQGRVSGGVASGVEQATGFMNRMRQGGLISATIDTAGDIAKSAAGVTPEARQKAIEEFLGLATK